MNRNDRLYNDYEDALFALLMDKVAQEEGARLLEENERLKNDPNAAVPPELNKKSLETIRRTLAGRQRRHTHTVGWYLGRLAIAILAALLLFVVAYASIPELQLRTLEMLIDNSDVSSRLSFAGGKNEEVTPAGQRQTLAGYTLPELSRKYVVTDQGETSREAWIEYQHENGSVIRININELTDGFFDSEDADVSEQIEVQGYSGILVEKQNTIRISWLDDIGGKRIYLTTSGVERKTALTYAEQIVYISK